MASRASPVPLSLLIIIILVAAGLPSSNLHAAFASLSGVTAESISIVDGIGNKQGIINTDSDFFATIGVTNPNNSIQKYVAVTEVRNAQDITVWLSLDNGVLGSGQEANISIPLSLQDGNYIIRTFVVDSDETPQLVSPIISIPISVVKTNYPGMYIPLYKYPDLGDPNGVWNTLIKTIENHPSVKFVVTVNPASGPGAAQSPVYLEAISELKKSGVEYILGYIPTRYATQGAGYTIEDLKDMVDRYSSWYPEVNGLMLDQTSTSSDYLDFYQEITSYARMQGMDFIRANPGTKPSEMYHEIFDNIAVYEGKDLPSLSQLQDKTYFPKYSPQSFSFTSRSIDSLDLSYISQIRNYVGLLYITDGVENESDRNPYNELPSYFADLVRLIDPTTIL